MSSLGSITPNDNVKGDYFGTFLNWPFQSFQEFYLQIGFLEQKIVYFGGEINKFS